MKTRGRPDLRPIRQKSLEELEGFVAGEPPYDSYLVRAIYALRKKPIGEFTTEDLRTTIGQVFGTGEETMRAALSSAESELEARGVDNLSEDELRRWMFTSLCMAQSGGLSWFGRRRWQREHRKTFGALIGRALARMGPGPELCEGCHRVPPSQHLVYGGGAVERFGHFCSECSKREPSPWLAVMAAPRKR